MMSEPVQWHTSPHSPSQACLDILHDCLLVNHLLVSRNDDPRSRVHIHNGLISEDLKGFFFCPYWGPGAANLEFFLIF